VRSLSRGPMRRHFHKMHGLGNDFVIVDARDAPFAVTPSLAKAIADRRTGVGCDQLIVLEPSDTADLKMRIWNSDGGEVESCGNATRCVVQLTGAKRIDSDGGLLEGLDLGAEVEVMLAGPKFGWDEIPLAYAMDTNPLPMAWEELARPVAVNVGNPHLVFFVPDAREVPLDELGPNIEHDPVFPERINVNVASCVHGVSRRCKSTSSASATTASATDSTAPAISSVVKKRCSPMRMRNPKPPCPIRAVTVTSPIVLTVATRMPAMMTAAASGSSIRQRTSRGV